MSKAATYDPVLVEVIRNELAAVSEEMSIATAKTARSAMVKVGDLTTAIADAEGRPLGVGEGLGLFMFFSLAGGLVKRIRAKFGKEIHPGDVFIVNDPYSGGSHMPDLWVAAPQFCDGTLAAFALMYTHHTDVGGHYPGGQSGYSRESYEEGLRIPIVKVMEAGKLNEGLLDVVLANVRHNEEYRGDVEAKITGCWRATQGFNAIFAKYGLKNFRDTFDHIHEYTLESAKKTLAELPKGTFRAEMPLPDNGLGEIDPELVLRVAITIGAEKIKVDFTGTGPQAKGGINCPLESGRGTVYGTLRRLLFPQLPLTSGMMDVVDIVVPEGTVLNPRFPGAVGARAMTMFLMEDLLHRALAEALPGKIPVPCERWDLLHYAGYRPDGGESVIMDALPGGWGARPTADGPDGIAQAGVSDVPNELIELDHTQVIETFQLITDTGGPGKFRGSQAIEKTVRYLAPGRVSIRTNKIVPTPGMSGGKAGGASMNLHLRDGKAQPLPSQSYLFVEVQPGDRITHRVNGSGGHGDPLERDPERVLQDVIDDRLSVAAAAEQYGVVIAAGRVDEAKTNSLRASRRKAA